MKQGRDLQLSLISLEQMTYDIADKELLEMISFIAITAKRVLTLDATQMSMPAKLHLEELECELLAKELQTIIDQEKLKQKLAEMKSEICNNQLTLHKQLAEEYLQSLKRQLAEARQKAKDPQIALILKGLAFSLLYYLQEKKHPLLVQVNGLLEFGVPKKPTNDQINQAYQGLQQLKNELLAGLHQQFARQIADGWHNEPAHHEADRITNVDRLHQLLCGLNTLTEFHELNLEHLDIAIDHVDTEKNNSLHQSIHSLNLLLSELSKSQSIEKPALIDIESVVTELDDAFKRINSQSFSPDNLSELPHNEKENSACRPDESAENQIMKLDKNQHFLTSSHADLKRSLLKADMADLGKINSVKGSVFLCFGEPTLHLTDNSSTIMTSAKLVEHETNKLQMNQQLFKSNLADLERSLLNNTNADVEENQHPALQHGNKRVSNGSDFMFFRTPKPLVEITPTIEKVTIQDSVLFNGTIEELFNPDAKTSTQFDEVIKPDFQHTPKISLEELMFNEFVVLHAAKVQQKDMLRWLASKAMGLGMHDRLNSQDPAIKITRWQQVVDYADKYPTTDSATIRKEVEQKYQQQINTSNAHSGNSF